MAAAACWRWRMQQTAKGAANDGEKHSEKAKRRMAYVI